MGDRTCMAHSNSQAGPVSIILFCGHSQLEQQLYDAHPPGANTEMAVLGGGGAIRSCYPVSVPRQAESGSGRCGDMASRTQPAMVGLEPKLGCLTQSTGEGGSCGTRGLSLEDGRC